MSDQNNTKKKIRDRIQNEDNLLNSRTSIFLITNGLLLTAVGVSNNFIFQIILAILGALVTAFWWMYSWQNWEVIKALTIEIMKITDVDPVELIVQKELWHHGWRRPTDLISKCLPLLFFVTWIVIIGVKIIEVIL